MRSGQFNQPFQQHRLVDPGERQKVALDSRLDDPAEHVVAPPFLIARQAGGAWIAAEVEIGRQVEAECRRHLGERPVRYADRLEAPREAFTQPRLHQ